MGLFDLFSSKNEKAAAQAQRAGLSKGRSAAFKSLDYGLHGLRNQYGQAEGYFDPLADRYNQGSQMYANALGLGGDAGNAAAQGAFQAGPGYQFALDQGNQGILRNASARGMLAGGGTSADLMAYGQGLANQEYGGWLDRLKGYDPLAMQAQGARAGIRTGIGDAIFGTNQDKANIGWAAETGMGQANAQYQLSKDQTGANIFGAITGGLKLAAAFL